VGHDNDTYRSISALLVYFLGLVAINNHDTKDTLRTTHCSVRYYARSGSRRPVKSTTTTMMLLALHAEFTLAVPPAPPVKQFFTGGLPLTPSLPRPPPARYESLLLGLYPPRLGPPRCGLRPGLPTQAGARIAADPVSGGIARATDSRTERAEGGVTRV